MLVLAFLVVTHAPGDVAWVTSIERMLTPVRIEKIEGAHAIARPGQLAIEIDERGRFRAIQPSKFFDERIQIPLSDLEPQPPTKTSLRMRAVAEKDLARKKDLFGRALALDPFDDALAQEAGVTPTPRSAEVTRADLVYGCRGDLVRAGVVEGDAALTIAGDVCAARVEIRPPCAPDLDDTGLSDDDADALRKAADDNFAYAKAAHAKKRARLATFTAFGPGLRLVVQGGGVLWVTSSPLSLESCDCDGALARPLGDDARRIVLPALSRPALVYVKVPRYVGALHRIGPTKPDAADAVAFQDPFRAEPDDGRPGLEVFSAPEACDCAECS